jgi:hypothetical protein
VECGHAHKHEEDRIGRQLLRILAEHGAYAFGAAGGFEIGLTLTIEVCSPR